MACILHVQLLVNLLWHPTWDTRKAAEAVASRAQKADDLFSEALFDALSMEITTFSEQHAQLKFR